MWDQRRETESILSVSVISQETSRLSSRQELSSLLEKLKVKLLSRVQLFVSPWTVAYHAPTSMEFSRQEY